MSEEPHSHAVRADPGLKSSDFRVSADSSQHPKSRSLRPPSPGMDWIDVSGRFHLRLPSQPARLKRAAPRREQRDISFQCASGSKTAGVWDGIPLVKIIESVSAPPQTTHLHVAGADDHAAHVSIDVALDGILAFCRVDTTTSAGQDEFLESYRGMPRLLAPGADSAQMVRDVRAITAVSLSPGETPHPETHS